MAAADVMLVPLAPNPVFDMFVPSKLFDAMAAGRPVILSVPGEARRILEQSGAGVFVPPGDAAAMAQAIRTLKDDPTARTGMGIRGRRFVEDAYDRRRQSDRFTAAIESMAGASR
jgi:glycosyltransferase involved in cell wall biosynthesis